MSDFLIEIVQDRPLTGQWHCGPNPSWVTVTHIPTQIKARAYHRQQHKAREIAMACVELMVSESSDTKCSFPDLWQSE